MEIKLCNLITQFNNLIIILGHTSYGPKWYGPKLLWAEMVMGRNGYGPKWPVTPTSSWLALIPYGVRRDDKELKSSLQCTFGPSIHAFWLPWMIWSHNKRALKKMTKRHGAKRPDPFPHPLTKQLLLKTYVWSVEFRKRFLREYFRRFAAWIQIYFNVNQLVSLHKKSKNRTNQQQEIFLRWHGRRHLGLWIYRSCRLVDPNKWANEKCSF